PAADCAARHLREQRLVLTACRALAVARLLACVRRLESLVLLRRDVGGPVACAHDFALVDRQPGIDRVAPELPDLRGGIELARLRAEPLRVEVQLGRKARFALEPEVKDQTDDLGMVAQLATAE